MLTAALVIAAPAASRAQGRVAPFETLRLSLSLLSNVNRNSFHEQWLPGTGAELRVSAPFHAGEVELGVDQMSFESGSAAVPGFRSRFVFAGWGFGLLSRPRARWSVGGRLGSFMMRFDDATLPDYRRNENELGTELLSRIGWRPAREWEISVSGRYRTVLTEPRIRHVHLALTLSRDLRTPPWLRDFLD